MKIAALSLVMTIVAATVVSVAAGSGEPKHQQPFSRIIQTSAAHSGRVFVTASWMPPVIRPEAKNERPFTRAANDDPGFAIALRAIARNEIPYPGSHTPAGAGDGLVFSSGTGEVGSLVGLGLCMTALVCGLTLMRRFRQPVESRL